MTADVSSVFRELFEFLKSVGYAWVPMTPDRMLRCRQSPASYSALVRFLGLGLEVGDAELIHEGMPAELILKLREFRPAISVCGDYYVPHSHWPEPIANAHGFVYLGEESYKLMRMMESALPLLAGKSVLDLGSGAGGIAFELAPHIGNLLGIEASETAAHWSQAAALVQGVKNLDFRHGSIGTQLAEGLVQGRRWDIAVFNPPLAVPSPGSARLHRDGGNLGIELPLLFLDFANKQLSEQGEVFCLITNPLVHGRSVFFDELGRRPWLIIEKQRMDPSFNQSLYRKQGYADLGIQRVELWFLHLQKNK